MQTIKLCKEIFATEQRQHITSISGGKRIILYCIDNLTLLQKDQLLWIFGSNHCGSDGGEIAETAIINIKNSSQLINRTNYYLHWDSIKVGIQMKSIYYWYCLPAVLACSPKNPSKMKEICHRTKRITLKENNVRYEMKSRSKQWLDMLKIQKSLYTLRCLS